MGEPAGEVVRHHLAAAQQVCSSELTVVECERALRRAVHLGAISKPEGTVRRSLLLEAASTWHLLRLSEAVVGRARQPFPVEPIRTLDALHLASALRLRPALPSMQILTLDQRVRDNARELGFRVLPLEAP